MPTTRIEVRPRAAVSDNRADTVRTQLRDGGVSIQSESHDPDDEGVVRRGAFDVERTDFSGPGSARSLVVIARPRERPRFNDGSGFDAENWFANRECRHA